jgi:hypothetical protein
LCLDEAAAPAQIVASELMIQHLTTSSRRM